MDKQVSQNRRILICSDDAILVYGLKGMVSWEDSNNLSFLQASTFDESIQKYTSFMPDIVIIDTDMKGISNVELISEMQVHMKNCAIIILGKINTISMLRSKNDIMDIIIKPINPDLFQYVLIRNLSLVENYRRMQQQIENVQIMLMKAKSLLIQNLALEITRGAFELDRGLLDKRFAELGIRFDFQNYICFIAGIHITKNSKINSNVCFETIRNSIFEHFPIRTSSLNVDSLTIHDESHISIIIGYDQNDYANDIEDFINQEFQKMSNLFGFPYVLITSSTTHSISKIHELYQQTKKICDYQLFTMKYGIYHADSFLNQNIYSFILSLPQHNAISRHLIRKDIQALHRDLEQFRSKILCFPVADMTYILLATQEIIRIVALFIYNINEQNNCVLSTDTFTQKFFDFENIDELIGWLEHLFHKICNYCQPQVNNLQSNAAVECVKKYIDRNYSQKLSTKHIAQVMNYNPNYLGRLFIRYENKKICSYLHNVRIEKSIELLRKTRFSISRIAENVGYPDTSYFFKVFKKIVGITPIEYRIKHSTKEISD